MKPEARKRVAAAAAALAAYAACGDNPPAATPTPFADVPKLDYARPESIEKPDDYDIRIRLAARVSRSTPKRSTPPQARQEGSGGERTVVSTAYCLTGTMANGRTVHHGAVAMNGVPLGSQWEVVGTGHVYTVADRIGHGSEFDIAMPGDCAAARAYGRRTITVRRVA